MANYSGFQLYGDCESKELLSRIEELEAELAKGILRNVDLMKENKRLREAISIACDAADEGMIDTVKKILCAALEDE